MFNEGRQMSQVEFAKGNADADVETQQAQAQIKIRPGQIQSNQPTDQPASTSLQTTNGIIALGLCCRIISSSSDNEVRPSPTQCRLRPGYIGANLPKPHLSPQARILPINTPSIDKRVCLFGTPTPRLHCRLPRTEIYTSKTNTVWPPAQHRQAHA
ncbi:hypothetical protein CcaCcLH18_09691 [Colletotrichum camelliae]|nr:hypothetical protein CcaCcLH18_09691 [Colletotrichum camelliae]